MSSRECPICGKEVAQRFRPFCSARCADVDLNRWLTGAYSIEPDEADGSSPEGPENLSDD